MSTGYYVECKRENNVVVKKIEFNSMFERNVFYQCISNSFEESIENYNSRLNRAKIKTPIIHAIKTENNRYILVQEYVDGETVEEKIKENF